MFSKRANGNSAFFEEERAIIKCGRQLFSSLVRNKQAQMFSTEDKSMSNLKTQFMLPVGHHGLLMSL